MTSHGPVTRDVLQTLDEVRDRLSDRLDGLTDAEYLWEPVAGCLTVVPAEDGSYRADPRPEEESRPAPFTTIAWRIWHIGADCLRSYGGFFVAGGAGRDLLAWPGTAAEGVRRMTEDWAGFRAHVASLGDEGLLRPMGELGGPYAEQSYLLLALHALDEVAHHGAEIGVLRDLYEHGFGQG